MRTAKFPGTIASATKAALLAVGVLMGVSLDDSPGEEQKESSAERSAPISQDDQIKKSAQRVAEIKDFQTKLEAAKTPEEKRALVDQLRASLKASRPALPQAGQEEDTLKSLQRMARATDNPETKARLGLMEQRLQKVEDLKAALKAASEAKGEQKKELLSLVAKRRAALSEASKADMARMESESANRATSQDERTLPPEMAALKAKSEERRNEIDQLKESLAKASPQERAKLLDEWRAKRMQEMAAARADQNLESKQP